MTAPIPTLAFSLDDIPSWVYVLIAVVFACVVLGFGLLVMLSIFYKKVQQGTALVRTGTGGAHVSFGGVWVYPIVHRSEIMDISVKRIEIYRHGKEGLICRDNIRADIKVCFFLRVNNDAEDVLKVAQTIGCARASNQDAMIELFDAKFSEALKTVGKQFDFTELYAERERFKMEILKVIGTDLNGYALDDAAIDYLEQTPMNLLDPDNILDSEGIKKITDLTAKQIILANSITREKEKVITKQNVETREAILELERQQAEATEKQRREVSNITVREAAESKKVSEEERLKGERARITADEEIAVAEQNKQRQIIVAERNRERTDKVENERVERDRALEATERERIVTLAQIAKEKAVEQEKKNIQDVIRERVAVERAVVEQEEKIKDTREFALADRKKKVLVTEAESVAQKSMVAEVTAAESQKKASQFTAEVMLITAEGKRAAAEKEAQGTKMIADAQRAELAAPGLAEAEVVHARAAADLKQGEAKAIVLQKTKEAEAMGEQARAEGIRKVGDSEAFVIQRNAEATAVGLRQKLVAEADGITQKAEAMKKLDGVGKDHEEFKLKLAKDQAVDLAQISVQADIAGAQAKVLGEALKSAKIEIIGGDGNFFNQIASAVTTAKRIERALVESPALRDVKDTFFNGDSGHFRDELKRLVEMFGLTAADVRDLSVANAINSLIGKTKDKSLTEKLVDYLSQAKKAGVADEKIGKFL